MKQIFLLFFLAMLSATGFSQYVYKIKADSVKITNDSCNAELILENSTRHVNGFLYNRGNGRTEFRRGIIKVDDTTYIIGADTLKTGGSGKSTGGDFFFTANSRATGNRAHNFANYNLTIDSIANARLNMDSLFVQTKYGFKYGYNNNSGRISATSNGAFAGGYTNTDTAVIQATFLGAFAQGFANGGRISATARGAFAQGYAGASGQNFFIPSGASILASGTAASAQGYAIGAGDTLGATGSGATARGTVFNADMFSAGTGSYVGGYLLGQTSAGSHRVTAGSSSSFIQMLAGGQGSYVNIPSTATASTIFGYTGMSSLGGENSENRFYDTMQLVGDARLSFLRGGAFRTSKINIGGYASTTFSTANYLSSITNNAYQGTMFVAADTNATAQITSTGIASFLGGMTVRGTIRNAGATSFVYGRANGSGSLLENTGNTSFLFGSNTQNYQDSVFQVGWSGRQFRLTKDSLYLNVPNGNTAFTLFYNPTTKAVSFGDAPAGSNTAPTSETDPTAWKLAGNTVTGTGSFIGTINNLSLRVRTNNIERIIVDSTGNMGLGTASPAYMLDVAGTARIANLPFSTASRDTLLSYNPVTKQIVSTRAAGTLIGVRVLTNGTSYSPTIGTGSIAIELIGGGGGGGGIVATTSNNASCSGGGGSGARVFKHISALPSGSFSYIIGAGGTSGTTAGGNGGNGGATSIVINETTYTAPGGGGGSGSTSVAATALFIAGGSGASIGTSGDVNSAGQPGGNGMRLSGTAVASGMGGSTAYGGGGASRITTGVGMAGTGYGSGGGGAAAIGNVSGQAGGSGSAGVIIIYEYR
jgi:hypothetical protein